MNTRRFARAALVPALVLPMAACGVNSIPTKDEAVKAKWADVQGQLQRRSDLIPNLVQTVQAAGAQERGTLVDVQNARSRATSVTLDASAVTDPAKMQQVIAAQSQLSAGLGRLLAVSERYPDLKTNENFINLQAQLEGTENRIQVARRDYNEAVRDYNTTLRTFPTVLWAKTLYSGQKEAQPFSATEAAQTAPQVQFNIPAAAGSGAAVGGGSAGAMPGAPAPGAALPGTTPGTSTTTTTTAPAR